LPKFSSWQSPLTLFHLPRSSSPSYYFSVLSDLISEARATQQVMEAASNDIHKVNETIHVAPAPPPPPVVEADLFGDWGAPASASQAGTSTTPAWGAPSPVVTAAASSGPDDNSYEPPTEKFTQQAAISSTSYDSQDNNGFVASAPAPALYNAAPPVAAQSYAQAPPISNAVTRSDIEDAKKALAAAEQNARQAEETYLALSAETESLRKASEAAEADAMAKHDKAAKKRVGKKKVMKDAEDASIDAAGKKKHYLEMQSQTTSAFSVATESKREVDKLRHKVEQLELDFASAESTKDSAQSVPAPYSAAVQTNGQSWGIPDPTPQSHTSYGIDQSKAAPAFGNPQGYGNGMPAMMMQTQRSDDSFGFGDGIMGGGNGLSIPTPSGNDYNYNNPF
jgi:hypothetical protein